MKYPRAIVILKLWFERQTIENFDKKKGKEENFDSLSNE